MSPDRSLRRTVAVIFAALCVLAATPPCTPARADAVTVRDAAGRSVMIGDASRIVSVGGAVTEILYALGLEQRVIAVDSTSLYPPRALADKRNVGYMRQLSAEGVLGLGPSLVLAAEGAGPKETIAVLESASVPFVQVPDPFTGTGILAKVRLIAEATGVAARGECLAAAVERDLAALDRLRARIAAPRNVINSYDGYKLVNDEAVIAARPDAVLTMERPGFRLDAATVFALPAFATTPAAARQTLISMEGLYLLGFGPRTALAARDLAVALYPALDREAMPSDGSAISESQHGASCRQ
jgi:iron complex transport system substrate-binding protein